MLFRSLALLNPQKIVRGGAPTSSADPSAAADDAFPTDSQEKKQCKDDDRHGDKGCKRDRDQGSH